jgi:hypothetical protein
MAYPSEERLKNLEEKVGSLEEQQYHAHPFDESVFSGVIYDWKGDTSHAYLVVKRNTPDITDAGDPRYDMGAHDWFSNISDDTRYDKVYVRNCPATLQDLKVRFDRGDTVSYWTENGDDDDSNKMRGTFITDDSHKWFWAKVFPNSSTPGYGFIAAYWNVDHWTLTDISGNCANSQDVFSTHGKLQTSILTKVHSKWVSTDQTIKYYFDASSAAVSLLKINSAASGGGCYYVTIMAGTASVDSFSSSAEAMPYGMTTGANAFYVNTDENGQDTHLLKVDGTAYVLGLVTGMTISNGNLPVYMSESTIGATASPVTLDGASGTYNADTKNWARYHSTSGDNLGGVPFTLKDYTRLFLKETLPTVTLKGFSRDLTQDAAGRWRNVSAETSHDVMKLPKFDTDDDCVLITQDNHTLLTEGWAFSTASNQWVRICMNELDVVVGVFWDSSVGKLYYKKVTLYGLFGYSTTPTNVDVVTADPCPPPSE